MAKRNTESVLDLPVNFGNVNFGDKTARIGVEISRASISIAQADKNLCESRLTGTIVAKPSGDHPDQGAFEGMENEIELGGIFDVKGVAFTSDHIRIGLTFALKGLDASSLASFAKRGGRLIVNEVGDLPEGTDNGDDDE